MNLAENLLKAPNVLLSEEPIGIAEKRSRRHSVGVFGATFLASLWLLRSFERDHLLELGFA